MDPQHPQHQPLPRPSLFAASHDSRAAPPPRQYGPASSLHNGRSQPVYDRLGRRENETSRPPPYGYPSHSYAHEKPLSPVPFASLRNDAPNGFHTQPSSRGSLMKPGDGGLKDHGTLYREGRASAVLFRVHGCNSPPAGTRHGTARLPVLLSKRRSTVCWSRVSARPQGRFPRPATLSHQPPPVAPIDHSCSGTLAASGRWHAMPDAG